MDEKARGFQGAPNHGRGNLTQERIAKIDERYLTPKERAEEVWAVLQLMEDELETSFNLYDYLCFAVQFVGKMHIADFGDVDFGVIAQALNNWLHHTHYTHIEDILGPDRKEEV